MLHGLAQSIGITLLADVCAHASQQFVSVDRAGQVVVDAEFEAAKNLLAIVAISDEEDRQISRGLMRTRLTAEPQAVEGPKTETDDHEVDVLFARHGEGFARLVGQDDVMMRAQRLDDALK